jgi:23S rRNA (adenine1618-N6)-methyltransferase
MPQNKKIHPKEKAGLHLNNKHRERYDFKLLIGSLPELADFVKLNDYGDESIDFFNPAAVKMLNRALLKQYYEIEQWDIPEGYLCPPIPGRADYIHHIADLLRENDPNTIGEQIRVLDIGVGANCVYPIIGNKEYGWQFVGSDIDAVSIASANKIIAQNPHLKGAIELRLQENSHHFFQGIIQAGEHFDLSICNPPFHSSQAEAQTGTLRKLSNLKQEKQSTVVLNFGGQQNELWCKGGEQRFIENMIKESKEFAASCTWFSTLVSKEENIRNAKKALKKVEAAEIRTINMSQGNKVSRIVAWKF